MMKNSKDINQLMDLVDERIDVKLKDLQYMRAIPAKVKVINGDGTINVELAGTTSILTNIKNKAGTLVVNDLVYLYLPSGSLTNCFVGVKF